MPGEKTSAAGRSRPFSHFEVTRHGEEKNPLESGPALPDRLRMMSRKGQLGETSRLRQGGMDLTVPSWGRKILITGVSCVGKSSIGKRLAEILDCAFYDLDVELEHHFHMPLSRLKAPALPGSPCRQKAPRSLDRILQENRDGNLIVALPPSGLCDSYRKVIKKHGAIVIALSDTAENILQRIVFYDDDSNRIEKELDERGKVLYLREIRKDIGYFRRFHGKCKFPDVLGNMRVFQQWCLRPISGFAHQPSQGPRCSCPVHAKLINDPIWVHPQSAQ